MDWLSGRFRTSLAPVVLLLMLAWGALAFGAVYRWAYAPLLIACAALGVAGAVSGRSDVPWRAVRLLFGAVVLIGLAIGIQLVPLSRPVLQRVSLNTDGLLRQLNLQYAILTSGAVESTPRPERQAATPSTSPRDPAAVDTTRPLRHSLSVLPSSTRTGLALFACFALLLIGCARRLSARDARRVASGLLFLGVVLALVGIIQRQTFNGRIYGFWIPEAGILTFTPLGGPFGPFVNRNHFAGWMLMAVPVVLGHLIGFVIGKGPADFSGWRRRLLWLGSSDGSRACLIAFSILVMGLSVVLTLSRSGIACFAVALGLTGLRLLGRQPRRSRRAVLASYVVFVGLLAVGWAGVDGVLARFAAIPGADFRGRWVAWQDTARIIHDFPLTGTGIGTYGEVMAFYQTDNPLDRFVQAHNDYLQLAAEGGLLVTVPAVIFLVLFVREVRRRFREDSSDPRVYWIRAGAVTGLVAVALQEFVEFSLQMPGNAVLFVVLMAIAAGKLPHRTERRPQHSAG